MTIDRRSFIATSLAGAFSLGWKLPALAAGPAEVGIWAVVYPDDTVVVRIARS